jgi:hypothetical protein
LFEPLAQGLSPQATAARLKAEPLSLRVEALALNGASAGDQPVLTECTCKITAKTWA